MNGISLLNSWCCQCYLFCSFSNPGVTLPKRKYCIWLKKKKDSRDDTMELDIQWLPMSLGLDYSVIRIRNRKLPWNFPANNRLTARFEYEKDFSSFHSPLYATEPVMTEERRIRIREEACQRDTFQVIRPLIILLSLSFFFSFCCWFSRRTRSLQLSSQLMSVCREQAEAGDKRVYLSSRPFNVAQWQACFELKSSLVLLQLCELN